jgi:hypothetical protein
MNNAINNQFKMKMGSKQKDTEGSFNEKDSALVKQSPLYNSVIANALNAAEKNKEAEGNKYDKMAASFDAGKDSGEGEELMSTIKGEGEPQGGYAEKFSGMADKAREDSKNIDLLGSLSDITL